MTPVNPQDLGLVRLAAHALREDLKATDPAPTDWHPGEAWAAATRLGVPGLPGADATPTLGNLKQMGRACREWLKTQPIPPAGKFPPDQDLAPGDASYATWVEPRHSANEGRRILQGVRDAYPGPCDVVLLAVPGGKGKAFLQGLGMALEAEGKLVHRDPRLEP